MFLSKRGLSEELESVLWCLKKSLSSLLRASLHLSLINPNTGPTWSRALANLICPSMLFLLSLYSFLFIRKSFTILLSLFSAFQSWMSHISSTIKSEMKTVWEFPCWNWLGYWFLQGAWISDIVNFGPADRFVVGLHCCFHGISYE